jgi:hypothetical protein
MGSEKAARERRFLFGDGYPDSMLRAAIDRAPNGSQCLQGKQQNCCLISRRGKAAELSIAGLIECGSSSRPGPSWANPGVLDSDPGAAENVKLREGIWSPLPPSTWRASDDRRANMSWKNMA